MRKKCTKCGIEKEIQGGFYPGKKYISVWCIECHRKQSREWAVTNPEKAKLRDKKKMNRYFTDGPVLIRETKLCTNCNVVKTKEEFYVNRLVSDWLTAYCKSCHKKKRAENYRRSVVPLSRNSSDNKKRLRYYGINAFDKRNGFSTCSREEFLVLIDKPCFYCTHPSTGGDRINNDKGHQLDNLIPCCRECNMTRNNFFTVEEMKAILGPAIKAIKEKRARESQS